MSDHVGLRTWVATLIAAQASGFLTVVLIATAISLSERLVKLRTVAHMLSIDLVVTLSNAILGLYEGRHRVLGRPCASSFSPSPRSRCSPPTGPTSTRRH